jgi:hypothetical protein
MHPTTVVTPVFRVSYPSVFKPKLNTMNGKNEFSLEALFDKTADLAILKKAAEQAIMNKFGPDQKKWPKNIRMPFRDQSEKMKDDKLPDGCVAGATFMRLKSDKRPGVVDQNTQPILDESQFYAGCYARAQVNAYAYDQAGNRGVSFSLNHLQFVKDGEPVFWTPLG